MISKLNQPKFFILIIICISTLMIAGNHTSSLDWGDDNASYIMQAIYLKKKSPKEFIHLNTFTIENSTDKLGPIAYPWGYPALLAALITIFGLNISLLKSIGILSFILFLIVLIRGFRRNHSIFGLICLLSIFAFHPLLLSYTDSIGSDIPFLFVSSLALILIKKIIIKKRIVFSKKIDLIILGITISLAYFIRTIGLVLIFVLVFSQLFDLLLRYNKNLITNVHFRETIWYPKRIKELIYIKKGVSSTLLIPYFAIIGCFLSWKILLPTGGGYYFPFLENISTNSIKNQIIYNIELPSFFFAGLPFPLLLFGVTIPLFISGIIKRWKHDYHSIIFLFLYSLILVIWPYRQGLRFLFPVYPFYFSFVITGIESFYENNLSIYNKLVKLIFIIPFLLVIFWLIEDSTKNIIAKSDQNFNNSTGPFARYSKDMFTYIKENTKQESVIIFWRPRMMSFLTGRKSFQTHLKENIWGDYLCIYLRDDGWDSLSNDDLIWINNRYKSNIVFENPDFIIYKISNN